AGRAGGRGRTGRGRRRPCRRGRPGGGDRSGAMCRGRTRAVQRGAHGGRLPARLPVGPGHRASDRCRHGRPEKCPRHRAEAPERLAKKQPNWLNKEDHMGRIVVTEFISLDGVIEAPGGDEKNFKHAGWSFEVSRGTEGDNFKVDETNSSDALLLGRTTYQGFAAAWPSRTGELADKFNTMPKYVVSSTLKAPTWNNSNVLRGNIVDEASKLRATQAGKIVCD